jgi:DNA-binding transcriptional LysR family regulator
MAMQFLDHQTLETLIEPPLIDLTKNQTKVSIMENVKRAVGQSMIRPMQSSAQQSEAKWQQIDWRDARYFIVAAKCKSLKAAAKEAKCSLNTLRSHISRLEDQIGEPLFFRNPAGITLTRVGERLLIQVNEMQAAHEIRIPKRELTDHRELRLAVTEGLGAFWLVPRLVEFQKINPGVSVSLDCKMNVEDLNARSSDIAVQLERPTDPSLMCVKLGTMHLMPFASKEYLNEHGTPKNIQDGLKHRVVLQVAEQVKADVLSAMFGDEISSKMVCMRTNTSSSHYWAIARGVGIGVLPTYARAITKRIVPIDMEIKLRRDIWLIYHPDVRRSKIGQKAVQFLRQSFDPLRYPWFSENFLHPDEFETDFHGSNVVRLFAGFMDASDDD